MVGFKLKYAIDINFLMSSLPEKGALLNNPVLTKEGFGLDQGAEKRNCHSYDPFFNPEKVQNLPKIIG